ncbi:DNA mismatch repair protein MSH3 [Labeo rohita]|uniref:DNA mismatch repair protein MSH3 n=1 Tax=Labeo rohita TaxID=84645 RepID=A0ABQ8LZN9_LABRO|nr:DNA mismatch repair protein MSH3 [Labeo rohita]
MKVKPALPPGLFHEKDLYARKRWKEVQYMADLFWKRWIKEYYQSFKDVKNG